MYKYYIAYIYLDPVKGLTFDNMILERMCHTIVFENLSQSIDEMKEKIAEKHDISLVEDIVISSWQLL